MSPASSASHRPLARRTSISRKAFNLNYFWIALMQMWEFGFNPQRVDHVGKSTFKNASFVSQPSSAGPFTSAALDVGWYGGKESERSRFLGLRAQTRPNWMVRSVMCLQIIGFSKLRKRGAVARRHRQRQKRRSTAHNPRHLAETLNRTGLGKQFPELFMMKWVAYSSLRFEWCPVVGQSLPICVPRLHWQQFIQTEGVPLAKWIRSSSLDHQRIFTSSSSFCLLTCSYNDVKTISVKNLCEAAD